MTDLIGHTIGQYQIIERIGTGGMADVYKAYQPGLDRYVAIKILPEYLIRDETFLARFQREAKAIAKLSHPHILPVYDFGQQDNLSYIVMQYVETGTLKDMLGQPLDLGLATDVIGQVADALDYAHEQGIIHRDVKPSNVLMERGRRALLTDFGLAKMTEASVQLTGSGVGVGTPAYMSPEQGQGKAVDARSDVYSLGVILYEVLTGQVPYEAETPMAVVIKHITAPLPLPRKINPDIPETAERVVLKALAKDPADRYQSAGELVEALKKSIARVISEETAPVAPPEVGEAKTELIAMPVEEVAETRCPHCGGEVSDTARVCGHCGQPLGATAAPVQAAGLPGWALAAGGVLVVLAIVLAVALVVLVVLPSRAEPTPSIVVARPTVRPATATPLVPTTTPTPTETPTPTLTSTPTPTKTPTLTPTVTPTPLVLYSDDFSDPESGWSDISYAEREYHYEKGEYVIPVKKENYHVFSGGAKEAFTDFTLEADARQVEGPGSAQFGLNFRFRDGDNFYAFLISGDGTYIVVKKVNGKWQGVGGIDWTPSSHVKTEGATNHLKVVCQGPQIALYINGHHLATVSDDSFIEGKVGVLAAATKGSDPVKVAFDNLMVSEAEAIP